MKQVDVLVIGGGPAGSATAISAARAGLSVLVADRARFPRDKACAEYLSPEAGRDLEALGVLAAVEAARPERLHGFRLVSDDGVSVTGRFANAAGYAPWRPYGFALPRTTLDALLLDAARGAGADVREGVALERLKGHRGTGARGHGGTVTGALLREGDRTFDVQARLVVGADGLHSRVAHELGVARSGRPHRIALVAHFTGVTDMSDVGEMFAQDGWYVGLAAIGAGLVNAAMVVPAGDARAFAPDPAAFLLARLRGIPELAQRMRGATLARGVLVTGPFARSARRAIHDGALLVGDAADFFDPFTGEGIFAALRGGRLAADAAIHALRTGDATRAALAPYAAARRRAFAGKWALERLVGLLAVRPFLMRRFTHSLAHAPAVADLWVGAAGDSVPVRALFAPRRLAAFVG